MEQTIWKKDLTYLRKVGPERAKLLRSELALHTYGDLLHFFPRKYVDRARVTRIAEVGYDTGHITLVGKIERMEQVETKNGGSLLKAIFTDGTGYAEFVWFQALPVVRKQLPVGEEIAAFGKASLYGNTVQMSHPEIGRLTAEAGAPPPEARGIVPMYPSTAKLERAGLDARGLRTVVAQLWEEVAARGAGGRIAETLPEALCAAHQLPPRAQALADIHQPPSWEALGAAQRRVKFEELFFFQLMLAYRRDRTRTAHASPPFARVGPRFNEFYAQHLPFALTEAQKRVMREIRRDLAQPVQMNRLVQGDVGSGKTIVAFLTMLLAADNGLQAAMMAPTEILAEQHAAKIGAMAARLGLHTVRVVGSQGRRERREALEALASGAATFAIGTHALIEEDVRFQALGLVVVDEQHKFGVMQRARLWQKSAPYAHNLVMTATPIPRTLAMTLYGDVDVSVIDELPPGRTPILTRAYRESRRLEVYGFIRQQVELGRQAYVVYPLVEEREKLDLLAATQGFDLLSEYFKEYRVGIVHGKMKADDKAAEMQRFVENRTQILVSTTVIEVGVDVPNATLMVVENAERFGLSQLHQLRGRVGRGQHQSHCLLMAGDKLSSDGKARLKAMCETSDGFKIAEADLKLRGPGDFLGTRQSGLPEFSLANIVDDAELLATARQAAFDLLAADPDLRAPHHASLRVHFAEYLQKQAGMMMLA